MKTKYYPTYYPGDILYSALTGAFTIAKHGIRLPDYHVTSVDGVTYSEMDLKRVGVRLLRRADEPEVPTELPPLPDAPKDHHFVYRGTRWKAEGVVYAYLVLGESAWCFKFKGLNDACEMPGHYAELVPNEPYTPPYLRKLAEHLLTLTPEQREAEGFDVKDCATKAECFGNTGTLSPDPQLDHLDSRSLERDGVEFHGHPGVRSLEFRSSVRVTPKAPHLGVSPEVAAMLQKYELPVRLPPAREYFRLMRKKLAEDRRYLVLTIDKAWDEFCEGACVFYKHSQYDYFHVMQRTARTAGNAAYEWRTTQRSLRGKWEKPAFTRLLQSAIDAGHEVYVTDSRKNLKHFHSATEKL